MSWPTLVPIKNGRSQKDKGWATDMAQTKEGAIIVATMGVSVEEYKINTKKGYKRCRVCKEWKIRKYFNADGSRSDGLTPLCRECQNAQARNRYKKKPRPEKGRKFVSPRDDDKKQARRRINYLAESGLITKPSALPCSVCGHEFSKTWSGERPKMHEYHHHLGYSSGNHENVVVLCTKCHSRIG